LPGHIISPLRNALMCAMAQTNHMITSAIVRALQMPLMPGLSSTAPAWIAARVKPPLGKTKAHQFREKVIFLTPAITDTVETQKNQKEKRMRKKPARMPMSLITSPMGSDVMPKYSPEKTFGACRPREIRAVAVYPAGPTETYMPGRVGGVGRELTMSRCV
jgi:hypothetical protein